ncbi:MAG: helix-turn-helix domain-containing protein [Kofleriaceae bacterium]
MLSATSARTFSTSVLRTTIFLERRFRAHLLTRDRLLYDSAYAPAAKKQSTFVHLYASLRGTIALAGAPPISGPQAYVLAETEFDRVIQGARTFRSYGAPAVIVELRVPATDLQRPIGISHGPLDLPTHVWDAYQALEATQSEDALHQLIVRLGEAQVLSRDLTASVVPHEPERFTRLWTVLRPLYQDLATSASLKQIATIAGLSLRQLGRDLGELTRLFGLYGGGFRDAMRVLRLRAAVLFLSAPGGTPSDVAKAVGYGSLDAMGRAFRDAQLPAPSVVQDAVRYRE